MKQALRNLAVLSAILWLTACSSGHNITYSGHEESTEGVPGFVNGKKATPYAKLGQSYSVDGEEYVPRFQPDYVEEGMASWYGPGFHGGKTANGEEFDTHSFTAAHRTLPLPSIVKVTMLESGKSVYVRINDRGPYARGRIIDLSYGAAKQIGLVARGTGKVRVEYCLAESQRFADLLAQGREPDSIDVATEVLPYAQSQKAVQYAQADIQKTATGAAAGKTPATPKGDLAEHLNPIADAQAAENSDPAAMHNNDQNPGAIEVADLTPPVAQALPARSANAPDTVSHARGDPPPTAYAPTPEATAPPASEAEETAIASGVYLQLGTFSIHENAVRLQQRVARYGKALVMKTTVSNGYWYRVRMGPYHSAEQASEMAARLEQFGIKNPVLVRQ